MTNSQLNALIKRRLERDVLLAELGQEINRILARVEEIGKIKEQLLREIDDEAVLLASEGYGHGV